MKKYEWECNENQLNAMKMYTLDYQSYINSYFRLNPHPFEKISIYGVNLTYDEFLNLCNELDKICSINKLFDDTILYRGIKSNDTIERYIKNKMFPEKGFCSTSFDKDIAIEKATIQDENKNFNDFGWVMEIYAPNGTQGVYLHKYSASPIEQEFLLPRNINFKIFNVDKDRRILKVIDNKYL